MRRRIILESGVKTEKVTVQVTMSDGASAQGITVTINGVSTTTDANGLAYGEVTYGTNYSVVFSQKNSTYSTPATQSFTANQETRLVSATYTKYYETCTVTSNLSTTITINSNSKSNTKSHSVSVPYGTVYTVSVANNSNYNKPSKKTFTANTSSRSVTMNYTAKTESVTVYSNVATTIWINGTSKANTTSYTTTVPYGTAYQVYGDPVSGYDNPDPYFQYFTASTTSRTVNLTYTARPPVLYIYPEYHYGDGYTCESYDYLGCNFAPKGIYIGSDYYFFCDGSSPSEYKINLYEGESYTLGIRVNGGFAYVRKFELTSNFGNFTFNDHDSSTVTITATAGNVYKMYLHIYGVYS